ncbi:type II toxin-antitoxin system VapC family toxin [Rhodoferax antarcticus]|uniref:type II toxin-antitoxin system VapC family toxin n=1 Tax=Rhodoferax antarcticus TaxID=81479 RepID=UPI00222526A0|nr:type II toxin-antitoxin system VapC family toxin [Rhodoferax antarcticus]MCW2310319.1 tRNA(fMet)-specific endonuclease VapC [Rhodoferax antarcticus]
MTQRYMLDTNVVSHIMQGRDAALLALLTQVPVGQVVISSVTLAELEYGLHRKGQPVRLKNAMTQVLLHMDVLPWDESVARCYGVLCSTLEAQGINLSDLDMMIAAHAVAVDATLVSRDKAFAQVPAPLRLETW